MTADPRIFNRVSDWSEPPELHRHRAYEAADVEAFVERITTRVAELEQQVAEMREAGGAGLHAQVGQALILAHQAAAAAAHADRRGVGARSAQVGPGGPEQRAGSEEAARPVAPDEEERQAEARLAEAERQAEARLAEADRYFAARLVEADLQAQTLLDEARKEGRALVDAMRRSLEDAVRLKDEEIIAALGESHERVLAILDENLRKRNPQPHEPQYAPLFRRQYPPPPTQ